MAFPEPGVAFLDEDAAFGAGDGGGAELGEVGCEAGDEGCGGLGADEVVPFVGVGAVVVEFLGAVGVADVAVGEVAHGVVAGVVGGDGGAAGGLGVVDLWAKAEAFQSVDGGEAAEVEEGGVEVEEFCGLGTGPAFGQIGSGDDEGDAGGFLPEGVLSGDALLAEVPAVVGPEDDDGVFFEAVVLEGGGDAADLGIDEGHGGEVAAGEIFGLVGGLQPGEAGFGEVPVDAPGGGWGVVAVVGEDGGELEGVGGVEVEPFLAGEAGDVGTGEADGEKEGLAVIGVFGEELGAEGGDGPIALLFVVLGVNAPIDEAHLAGSVDEFLFWEGAEVGGGAIGVELGGAVFLGRELVVDLAGDGGVVAGFFEGLGEGGEVVEGGDVAEPGGEAVNAGAGVAATGHDGGARGEADGGLAVGVGEEGAPLGEGVDVRCPGLGMSAEAADPVVEVVDGDEDDVGFFCGGAGEKEGEAEEEDADHSFGKGVGIEREGRDEEAGRHAGGDTGGEGGGFQERGGTSPHP